jgi:hypothetical protein
LQLQLPQGRDSFNNVFRYDVSFEPTSGRGLTNTNSDTFCPLLLQYMIQSTTVGVLNQPCVTNAGADDGRINAAGQGYGVAAVIISETAEGGVFNAPRNVANEGLDAKNVRAANREYEMANRQNDTAYGNLVAELTYGDLYSKVCGGLQQRPKITIQNNTGGVRYARLQSTSVVCVAVNNGLPFDLYRNNDVQFYTNATCTAACGGIITYINSYAADNAGNGNGIAQISGACAMTDI